MKESKSSFKELPVQLEWAFAALIGYLAYLGLQANGWHAGVEWLTVLILLNGWISSRATKELYSDLILVVDVAAMCGYLWMALALRNNPNIVAPEYWAASSLVCGAYMGWDLAILRLVGKEQWKHRFRPYVVILGVALVVFMCLFALRTYTRVNEAVVCGIGAAVWLALLGKWHLDKMKHSHQIREEN